MLTSASNTSRMRNIRRAASSELPPRAKKLSSRPMSTPGPSSGSSRRQTSASCCSVGPAGGVAGPAAARSGAGSAARSTLPLAFSGSRSRVLNAVGTRYSGSRPARKSRSGRVASASGSAPSAGVT